jgi:hypothetical protein
MPIMHSSADFYLGLGVEAEWIGSIGQDARPCDMQPYLLFGPAPEGHEYGREQFVQAAKDAIADAIAEGHGWDPDKGDTWPWDHHTSRGTGHAYCYHENRNVHVFEDGFLVALHYPNGTRKPAEFPKMTR